MSWVEKGWQPGAKKTILVVRRVYAAHRYAGAATKIIY
jgi:hypothetical protein